jgi:hypothetical protein
MLDKVWLINTKINILDADKLKSIQSLVELASLSLLEYNLFKSRLVSIINEVADEQKG